MVIIMLGAQGTGKGTIAGMISEKTNWPQISTGDIFRKNISEKTELGVQADKYGFPRTTAQAEKLDEILAELGKKVDLVINLSTPKEELIDRMLTRRVCSNQECKTTYNIKLNPPKVEGVCDKCGAALKQREDDSNPESINRRLEIYEEQTSPLVEYYDKKGVLRTETVSMAINRMGKDVAEDIIRDIKKD